MKVSSAIAYFVFVAGLRVAALREFSSKNCSGPTTYWRKGVEVVVKAVAARARNALKVVGGATAGVQFGVCLERFREASLDR